LTHKYFEAAVLVAIIANCLLIASKDPLCEGVLSDGGRTPTRSSPGLD
jgi:hypothetical protein